MYMRPQLSRRRTGNREILSKEHCADTLAYNELLADGMGFESDVAKISCLIDEISNNESLSGDEKEPILQQLSQILCALKKEYSVQVEYEQMDIEFSMKERICEMESATRERESEVYDAETTVWQTGAVDKDKLIMASRELFQKYQIFLDESRAELHRLIREAEKQRLRIRENRTKR